MLWARPSAAWRNCRGAPSDDTTSMQPDSAPAHLALGSALLQTGQTPAAVTELEAAKRLEPRMRQAYFLLGRAYRALGRSSEAEAAFARVQELVRQEGAAPEATLEEPSLPPQPPDPP